MIGTIEALGVFLLAILPGVLILRVYRWGRPPLRLRGTLSELGVTVVLSGTAWVILYLWRGQDLLPIVLGDPARRSVERLDAFMELAGLSILLSLALGVGAKALAGLGRAWFVWKLRAHDPGRPSALSVEHLRRLVTAAQERFLWGLRRRTLPDAAWDRLLTRLANRGEAVICRVTTRNGGEVLGVFADAGFADYEVDGRGLLLDAEVVRSETGALEPLTASRGVFVPGDEISVLRVVGLVQDE